MNNKIIVRFREKDLMYEEKLDVLTKSVCKSIFPISIVHNKEILTGYYRTNGYRKIGDFDDLTGKASLVILEKVLNAIEECSQYLIFPEEYVINTNTVYVDPRFNNVKFTYIPDTYKNSGRKKIKYLINQLKNITTESDVIYLDMLYQMFDLENISFMKAKLIISKLICEAEK